MVRRHQRQNETSKPGGPEKAEENRSLAKEITSAASVPPRFKGVCLGYREFSEESGAVERASNPLIAQIPNSGPMAMLANAACHP
jgi:hypothetical protein